MTATLSTRIVISHYGDGELEIEAEYVWGHGNIEIGSCTTRISGQDVSVWHHLSQYQREHIYDQCREDYAGRMDSVRETRYEDRHL